MCRRVIRAQVWSPPVSYVPRPAPVIMVGWRAGGRGNLPDTSAGTRTRFNTQTRTQTHTHTHTQKCCSSTLCFSWRIFKSWKLNSSKTENETFLMCKMIFLKLKTMILVIYGTIQNRMINDLAISWTCLTRNKRSRAESRWGGRLTYKAMGKELVDRSEGEACDWSGGVLGADHFQEGPQENIGLDVRELWGERHSTRSVTSLFGLTNYSPHLKTYI